MQSVLSSNTNSILSDSTNIATRIQAASAPVAPISSEVEVKQQISAPSYFFSLKENEAPPFQKPVKEPRPKLLIGNIINEEEVIALIAAADTDEEQGFKKFLGWILQEKKIIRNHDLSEKHFLISLLTEAVDYAAQRDFNALKLSVLLTIYLETHCYFKWYYWQSPIAVWNFFKELMVRHTIEDSPDGQEVFSPEECYNILTHFHAVYVTNLPLIHIVTFRTQKIKFLWPFVPAK